MQPIDRDGTTSQKFQGTTRSSDDPLDYMAVCLAVLVGVSLVYLLKPGPTVLQNNVPIMYLSGDQGRQEYFQITVPPGYSNLTIQISGGNGNADLYVKHGSLPTRSSWDYRSDLDGNNETVHVTNPASGDWYIMNGYAAYSGIMLGARFY